MKILNFQAKHVLPMVVVGVFAVAAILISVSVPQTAKANDTGSYSPSTIVEPEPKPVTATATLSIIKNVNKSIANPGDKLTYTVTVSNSSNTTATNVTVSDKLPAGLTFVNSDGSNSGETEYTWPAFDLAAGTDRTFTYDALVDSNATVNVYDNVATVSADNIDPISAKASTEVRIPVVLGDETPSLTITKSVNKTFANAGDKVTYTVKVTNNGDKPALNAVLTDTLPTGFVFTDNNAKSHTWALGDIVPSETVTKTYEVKIDASIPAGKYKNTATVKANNTDPLTAQATLEVKEVKVLGAETTTTQLPATGGDLLGLLSGALLIGSGIILKRKLK